MPCWTNTYTLLMLRTLHWARHSGRANQKFPLSIQGVMNMAGTASGIYTPCFQRLLSKENFSILMNTGRTTAMLPGSNSTGYSTLCLHTTTNPFKPKEEKHRYGIKNKAYGSLCISIIPVCQRPGKNVDFRLKLGFPDGLLFTRIKLALIFYTIPGYAYKVRRIFSIFFPFASSSTSLSI